MAAGERAAGGVVGGVVVGAAVVRDGRVLAARRARPPALAGRWELPGGAVEDGETEPAALARELREELALAVRVRERVGPDVALPDGRTLRVHRCEPDGEPRALEHLALAWVGPDDLDDVDWVDADRAVLPALAELLRAPVRRPRRPRGPLRPRGPS